MSRIQIRASIATFLLVMVSMSALASTERFGVSATDANKSVLFENLSNARNEVEGRDAEAAIWQFWFSQSPDAEIRASLDAGIERREAYDFEAAETHFDNVIRLAPNYAEGFNQRAFIRFLRQNYAMAQADLEVALELEPAHFGALSGLYHILLSQNKSELALRMLQKAVEIHPWLKERTALPEPMWPDKYRVIHGQGQEI